MGKWAGVPDHIVHDQGGGFFKHFGFMLRELSITTTITATEAPWQHGVVERHGQVLAEVMSVIVDQCQLTGATDMRMDGIFAVASKNRRTDRTGHSARGRVFGTTERFPGSVVDALQDGERPVDLDHAWRDPVLRRATTLRSAAQTALAKMDADARWQQAMPTGIRPQMKDFVLGAQVYFWRAQKAPQALRGWRACMVARWSGPAIVLGKTIRQGTTRMVRQSYWIAFKGSLLLVAAEHLRSATREEVLADAVLNRALVEVREALDQD
jgi:hypothetical protein